MTFELKKGVLLFFYAFYLFLFTFLPRQLFIMRILSWSIVSLVFWSPQQDHRLDNSEMPEGEKKGRTNYRKKKTHTAQQRPTKPWREKVIASPTYIASKPVAGTHSTHTRSGFLTFQWSLKLVRYCKSRNVVWTGFFLSFFFIFTPVNHL